MKNFYSSIDKTIVHDLGKTLTEIFKTDSPQTNPVFPTYNKILDKEAGKLTIQVALAGYAKTDIKVDLESNILTVKTPQGSSVLPSNTDGKVSYRGIFNNKHEIKFKLSSNALVESVKFDNGLLSILVKQTEDEPKVKSFEIN